MHYGPIYRHGARFLTWLIPISFILLIIFVLYMMVFKKKGNNQEEISSQKERKNASYSALKILNEGYAKGELNDEEYQRMKKNLLDLENTDK